MHALPEKKNVNIHVQPLSILYSHSGTHSLSLYHKSLTIRLKLKSCATGYVQKTYLIDYRLVFAMIITLRGVARNLFWGYKGFLEGGIKLLNSRSDVIFTP